MADLGAQFYLTPADVGTNRATACAAKLQELNPAVLVTVVTDALTDELCAKHQVLFRGDARSSFRLQFFSFRPF